MNRRRAIRWVRWAAMAAGIICGILPGQCENTILRIATPFLI